MVTHDMQIAAYADRRLHLVDGRLAEPLPVQPLEPLPARPPAQEAWRQSK